MTRYAALCFAVCGLVGWQGYRVGVQHEVARSAAALLKVNAENAEIQKALMRGVEKVAEDAEIERADIEQRLAHADDAVEQLRAAIDSADDRANPGPTCIADAARARSLLADCAGKYKVMANEADKLRATVIGLQAYVRTIRRN